MDLPEDRPAHPFGQIWPSPDAEERDRKALQDMCMERDGVAAEILQAQAKSQPTADLEARLQKLDREIEARSFLFYIEYED